MNYHGVEIPREAVADLCRRNHIVRLSFFGSVLREDFGPDSDVDVLVEFAPKSLVTFLDMAQMQEELSQLLGRQVDLRTPQELSRYFRDEVLSSAVVQYAA